VEDLASDWHERPDDGRRALAGGHMMECHPSAGADPDFEKKNAEAAVLVICGDRQCSRSAMNSNYSLIVANSSAGDTLRVTIT
jgi:hypothetical protein